MKIEITTDEIEEGEEFISSLSFIDCSRKDLEELSRLFYMASRSLPVPRISEKEIQVSQIYLNDHSEHFKGFKTLITVSLDVDEN